jgi:prepilin-type N-terminal cleavage/methylation domain-containing protein
LIRISRPTTSERGFTLIELLVVVALIMLISLFALPSISSYFGVSLNSAARDLATTMKEAYNATVVTGKVHRLVFNLKDNTYWAEVGPATALLDTKESKEKEERHKRFAKASAEAPPSGFSMDTSVTRKKISLPRGTIFEDVITQQGKDPITEGSAYSHIFPNGLTEQTIIHLTDSSKHHVTLVISALIGRTDMYDRYLNREEAFNEK